MSTGNAYIPLQVLAYRFANSVFVSLLVISGMLMIPVSCTCGASTPHGHSLFQLPHHNHSSVDDHAGDGGSGGHDGHSPDPAATSSHAHHEHDEDCDDEHDHSKHRDHAQQTAFSNALEKQDSAFVQAPPSSSVGHPIAMMQPPLITLAGQQCERLILPPTRTLDGTEPSPETPPPRDLVTI